MLRPARIKIAERQSAAGRESTKISSFEPSHTPSAGNNSGKPAVSLDPDQSRMPSQHAIIEAERPLMRTMV